MPGMAKKCRNTHSLQDWPHWTKIGLAWKKFSWEKGFLLNLISMEDLEYFEGLVDSPQHIFQ